MERREGVTVLVPTSPIPSHPSAAVIDDCLDAVRRQLPVSPILIAADGWHDGACTREEYDAYLAGLYFRARYERERTRMVAAEHWLHEANLTRLALPYVETDLVLFVEHDYALVGVIDWTACVDALRSGLANMIRLSMEPSVPEPWRPLYLEPDQPWTIGGAPMLRTIQWLTRPYLARTDWLEEVHERYVGDGTRCFLETIMHAVVANSYLVNGEAGWDEWRLWMYAPPGDMTRFVHTDGRGDAPTRPVTITYPGETPEYAPAPVFEAPQ